MSMVHVAPMFCINVRIILHQSFARSRYYYPAAMPALWHAGKAHLLLDCAPKVLNEMEPISYLECLWRTLASSLRIDPTPVSAHDVDGRVLLQLLHRTRHAAVLKEIDYRTALQVHDHRAVAP